MYYQQENTHDGDYCCTHKMPFMVIFLIYIQSFDDFKEIVFIMCPAGKTPSIILFVG